MNEIWKDIPGFEGYQVSNLGRVRTYNKVSSNNKYKNRHWKSRILIPKGKNSESVYKTGYKVDLWKSGKPNTMLVSRLVAFTFLEEKINNHNLTVNHKDGNRLNNNLENLELISLKENIQHAFKMGLQHQTKVKIEDKITGTIIYPSSLAEGSKLMGHNHGYLSAMIKNNKFENSKFMWELVLNDKNRII